MSFLYPAAHKARFWVVGFNLNFDLSRLAVDVSKSVDYLAGGFSLVLADYEKDGVRKDRPAACRFHAWLSRNGSVWRV